jgi:hypothetical protein
MYIYVYTNTLLTTHDGLVSLLMYLRKQWVPSSKKYTITRASIIGSDVRNKYENELKSVENEVDF